MNSGRITVAALTFALVFAGCHRQKAIVVAPAGATPPDAVPNAVPAVPAIVTTASADIPKQAQKSGDSTKVATATIPKAQKRPPKRKATLPPAAAQSTAEAATPPVVAENRLPFDLITTPSDTSDVSQQSTKELISIAKRNVASVHRNLSDDEKAMAQQVDLFIHDSEAALNRSDNIGAHNLAVKAQLLSVALVRGR